jgi:hypothetical protein
MFPSPAPLGWAVRAFSSNSLIAGSVAAARWTTSLPLIAMFK